MITSSLLAACGDDEVTPPSTPIETSESTPVPTFEPMPAPEELALVYNVAYTNENTKWTITAVSQENVDGTDCYIMEATIDGQPKRLRLQGELEVNLLPLSETYWRNKESLDPVKTESSVNAFGSMEVNTPRTFTYTGSHGTPFSIGKSWTYDVLAEPSMGKSSTTTWNAEVAGAEEIMVPAGTFDCYKVEHTKAAVDGTPVESPIASIIEWWSVDDLFLSPVKTIDHSTYTETEIRALEAHVKAEKPIETPDTEILTDAERLTTGKAWEDFCDSLKASGEIILNPTLSVTDQDQSEGYRHLLRLLWVSMNELMENDDPLRPYFTRYPNVPTKIGHDNPDNVYSGGSIRGDQTYRVTGTIGTNIFTSFNVYSGFIGFDPYEELRTISSLNSEEMEINLDGSFEIILSADPHPGNWLKLESDAKMLV
ncbi:hypothetical protein ACFLU3_06055, partial [Chloroflexota bacterium]